MILEWFRSAYKKVILWRKINTLILIWIFHLSPAAMFQGVRALMIVGIVLGAVGLLIAIFALKCIRIGSMEDAAKANITLTSGILFIVAGELLLFWFCISPFSLGDIQKVCCMVSNSSYSLLDPKNYSIEAMAL